MRAAKEHALDHLMDAVKAVVSTIRTPGRRSRERMTAAKLLMQFCEGGMAQASSDSVDAAVRIVVVDQSQLSGELAKRVRSA